MRSANTRFVSGSVCGATTAHAGFVANSHLRRKFLLAAVSCFRCFHLSSRYCLCNTVSQYLFVTFNPSRCLLDKLQGQRTAMNIAFCALLVCIGFRSARRSVLRRFYLQMCLWKCLQADSLDRNPNCISPNCWLNSQ